MPYSVKLCGKKIKYLVIVLVILLSGCQTPEKEVSQAQNPENPYILILGTAQDAGYPQQGCYKSCCVNAWEDKSLHRSPACLAVVDPVSKQKWLFEATPDIKTQLNSLHVNTTGFPKFLPDGVFLTHAHIGHYTGLIHFGREVMGTQDLPVYTMPKMQKFLSNNGPWSQLIDLNNIALKTLEADSTIILNERVSVSPFRVPHRDEFSETVGFRISGKEKSAIFIPDIDKWEKWERSIIEEIKKVDLAFLDGTFFRNGEIPGRDMSEIPHPFIEESMTLFENLPESEKNKIHFIHFNHTNPVLDISSHEHKALLDAGFKVAYEGMVVGL